MVVRSFLAYMEIDIPFDFKVNLRTFLRRAGYTEFVDPNTSQASYTRRLSRDYYPRFHLYLKERDGKDILNLHLDQKKPSYPGSQAHSGEYDTAVVQREVSRIQGLIKNQIDNQVQQTEPKKKGFFAKLFS